MILKTYHFAVDRVQNCRESQNGPQCFTNLPQVSANTEQLRNGLAIAFGLAAAISVLVLVIAAFNFATAATDTEKISRSRKAIAASLLGLVISLSAEAIVLTLIGKL